MRNIWIILGFALLAAVAGVWISKPLVHHSPAEHALAKDSYYCPMHPTYTSDRPGKCPICHMDLVKRKSPDESSSAKKAMSTGDSVPGYSAVSLDTQRQQLIGMKTMKVTRKTLTKTIHAYGYVAHDLELYDAQLEYIDAWQQYYAFVIRRPVVSENSREDWWKYYDKPTEGRWRSSDKLKAQQRMIKAEYELTHMGLTGMEIEQLRKIKQGRPWVQPDLLFFDESHPTWIYAQIRESDLGFIALTQKVKVTIPAYGETAEGIIRNMSLTVDPQTRTARARIELPNYRSELKVNMSVTVDIPVELDEAVLVPRGAIMDTGLNKIVYVQLEDGVFEPRNIQTGFEGDGMVVVKSGLKEGETVVVSGNFLLDSESRLQSALSGGGHQHGQ